MTDNPILWVLLAIGAILLFVLLLAGITSLLTAFFGKRYALRLDRTYCGRMSALLPGEDCGACGYSQCSEYAEAALYMDADADRCPKMTAPVRQHNIQQHQFRQLFFHGVPELRGQPEPLCVHAGAPQGVDHQFPNAVVVFY